MRAFLSLSTCPRGPHELKRPMLRSWRGTQLQFQEMSSSINWKNAIHYVIHIQKIHNWSGVYHRPLSWKYFDINVCSIAFLCSDESHIAYVRAPNDRPRHTGNENVKHCANTPWVQFEVCCVYVFRYTCLMYRILRSDTHTNALSCTVISSSNGNAMQMTGGR